MNKVISILCFVSLLVSCATQQKSVELANGKFVTQKQYDRMLDKAFKHADKEAKKSVRGLMSKKDIKTFKEDVNVTVVTDTIK